MAIRGSDAQIMVARTSDFVHDAVAQLKGAERMQDFLAVQKQSDTERDKTSVGELEETPKVELRLENEGGSGSEQYTSQQNEEPPRHEYMELLDADVGPSEHTVDVIL
ncbi:MAG: hypothetical protein GX823_00065 [Clostridiales bacterium]|nr:hypothetical protein [Clostridiales bacterium]